MCMPVFKEHFVEKVCDVVLGGIIDLCVVLDLFFFVTELAFAVYALHVHCRLMT